jgi:hypothetical protein
VAVLLTVGSSLTVTVERQPLRIPAEPWYDTALEVSAPPFAGRLETVFTLGDLHAWGTALRGLPTGVGQVVLGGGRACELSIDAQPQQGGEPGLLALELSLTPSGDDPWPRLTWLAFDVTPDWAAGAGAAALALV